MDDAKKHEDGLKSGLKALEKLKRINNSTEFNDYFDFIMNAAASKMFNAFIGDNVKSYEDFLKIRGEVVAFLVPIQEIRGAEAMEKQLKDQLNTYYGKNL